MENNGIMILGESNSSMLGCNGMERLNRVHLSKGVRITFYGYGMNQTEMVVCDDNMNAVALGYNGETLDEYSLSDWSPIRSKLDDTIRPMSKVFGIGYYYHEDGELMNDDEINKALERADKLETIQRERDERIAREREENKKLILAKYSHLKRVDLLDYKEQTRATTANIKQVLADAFEGQKFSVKYQSYSGGSSYRISWTDGATQEEVDKIVRKFQKCYYDGMTDMEEHCDNQFADFFGGASYVFVEREFSDDMRNSIKDMLTNDGVTEDNWRETMYNVVSAAHHCSNYNDVVYNYMREHSFYVKPEKADRKVNKQVVSGDFSIVDYSDKAIAVTGDTFSVKSVLKQLGGRFNAKLSCGAGWVFPKSKESEVRKALAV